ncbi:hypothetical protein BGZ60DRAFT_482828 [Tricladium varicosporioides]|nr:hypothetical protein BGZ60DRAFT_482828 [Hymenoscyphus varicosporioides]
MHVLTYLLFPAATSAVILSTKASSNPVLYFLDNNPAGADIVSLKISNENGTLSNPVRTSTRGKGMYGLAAGANGVAAAPVGADTLFVQDSVVVSEDYLFTVNPGSNTVSMFIINRGNPQYPKLLNTVSSMGEFPVAVAYSSSISTACVINGGAVAGVACFSTDRAKGLVPIGTLRPIALSQTTPPIGPPGTVSDLVFNPSSSALVATIKGSPTSPGSIYVYPVLPSCLVSTTPTISKPLTLLLDFSLSFLGSDSKAIITDPVYGAALVTISSTFSVSVTKKIVVPDQKATCWSLYSPRFDTVFLMDGGNTNVTIVNPSTGAIKGQAVQSAAGMGSLDAVMNGEYLYVLKTAPLISVSTDMGGEPREVLSFDLSALGSRQGWTGLAVYPSSA